MEIRDWFVTFFVVLCFIGVAVRTRNEHGRPK